MYEEDFIFGPLTWRQFVYIASGTAVATLAFLYLHNQFNIAVTLVAIGVGAKLAYDNKPTKIELENLETYLQEKKITLGGDKFKTWLKRTIAEKTSYLAMKRNRGFDTDVELEQAIEILKEQFKQETSKDVS